MRADRDRPHWRTIENRREKDIAFLEKLRTATVEQLAEMVRESKKWPEWRKVALSRAVQRQGTDIAGEKT